MGLDLTLAVEESGKFEPGDAPAAGRSFTCRVQLRGEWIRYRGDPDAPTVVLDFARRHRLEEDAEAGTYAQESIYPLVALRHFELPNRAYIRSVIEAGAGDASDFEPVVTEHKLSVHGEDRATTIAEVVASRGGILSRLRSSLNRQSPADISVDTRDGLVVCALSSGAHLLSYSSDGVAVEPEEMRRFVQFLRYTYGGHPLILERMAAGGRVPREIRYSARGLPGSPGNAVSVRADSVERVEDGPLSRDGLRRIVRPPRPIPIQGALERATFDAPRDPGAVAAQRKAEGLQAAQAGRLLEAVLAAFELTLETGDPLAGFSLPEDVGVRRLMGVMGSPPRGEADLRSAIATLVELREQAGQRKHILMAFESGFRAALEETEEARALLCRALEVNPFLTVAYKDLGDLYMGEFDMRPAWLCWEAARTVAPGHPTLQAAAELEAMLAEKHPEYFDGGNVAAVGPIGSS